MQHKQIIKYFFRSLNGKIINRFGRNHKRRESNIQIFVTNKGIKAFLTITSYTFLLATIVPGCKKFVTVNPPQTELTTASVFSDDITATSAVTVIYSQMINQNTISYAIPFYTGMSGDELTNYSNYKDFVELYDNGLNAVDNGSVKGLWSSAYNYIYEANVVIAGLKNATGISSGARQQLTGEAMFIRAFWHFYLTNLWGDVPLITNTDYTVNAVASRTPQAQVYKQIIADLVDAQGLLNGNFVDASDTTITTERTRPTKSAAIALLARAYLYTGDYADAEAQATTVINNLSLFSLDSNLNNVFLMNSGEAIWQLQPVVANTNTPEGYNFILTGAPSNGSGYQTTSLSQQLLSAFETGDLRRFNWVDSIFNGTNTYYFPYKYKAGGSATSTTEYSMVLRLAEQYLIRAEARAQQQNITGAAGALSDLNVIRNRAHLLNYPGAMDQASVLAAILHERQIELFAEWGHRWLDLKRTGAVNTIMPSVSPIKGGSWNTNWQLYPIPQSDRSNDPNLTQNNGY
jgi:hypothetical protein